MKADIGKILRELCTRKGIEIIEAECCPNHIHMLVRILPKYSVLLSYNIVKKKFEQYKLQLLISTVACMFQTN